MEEIIKTNKSLGKKLEPIAEAYFELWVNGERGNKNDAQLQGLTVAEKSAVVRRAQRIAQRDRA